MPSYRNAADILPAHLLAQVQKYYGGRLWVPKTKAFHKDRRRLVERLLGQGVPAGEVADLADLTVRRVQQIGGTMAQAARRERGAPD